MTNRPSTAANPTVPQAIGGTACLPMRPRSRNPFSRAPRNGRTGMTQSSVFITFIGLALELRSPVERRGLAQAEEGDEDAEPHRRLAGGDGDREDGEDLARQVR